LSTAVPVFNAHRLASSAGWKLEQPPGATAIVGVVTGVKVYADKGSSDSADKGSSDSTETAARELVTALSDSDIAATFKDGNNNPPTNKISIQLGVKP
jgi:hypothetical protein